MTYFIAPLFCRPWTLNGIPQQVLRRLKRDELALLNSTLLHELYFASLGGDGRSVPESVAGALVRSFGSVDRWRAQFIAMAESLLGESGWVLLSHVPRDEGLINHIALDNSQSIPGAIPVLALDMYEHAYQLEFGANPTAYIAAFMRNIDWAAVQARLEGAASAAEAPRAKAVLGRALGRARRLEKDARRRRPVQVIDARPRHYATRSHELVSGSVWRDPERVDEWIGELSKEKPVVTFCVYGFHVGCETAATLRKAGFDARYMSGGHYAWKAINGPTKLFE